MENAFDLSTDVIAAGAALAGLLLVYVGGVGASLNSYRPEDQSTLRGAHLRRAWMGVTGFLFSVGASILGLLAKWLEAPLFQTTALVVIFISFGFVVITAFLTALDI